MNRVFICGYFNFPRGGAPSNYVQYLAKIFLSLGKEVTVITDQNPDIALESGYYQGIKVEGITLKPDKIGHFLDFHFRMGYYIEKKLTEYDVDSNDIIIAYSRDSSTLNAVLRCGKKRKIPVGVCLVEWFEKSDYEKGLLDLKYWNSLNAFQRLNKRFDFIFPISSTIEDFYKKKSCNTFRLPCLADTTEFPYVPKEYTGKRIVIYPGNGKMKDDLQDMLQALSLLTEEEMRLIEFHICGIEKTAKSMIANTSLQKYVGESIIIHKWMPYEELVGLYQSAHFMLLARKKSRMTESNFPSKIPETLSYGIIPICSRVGDYTRLYLKNGENCIMMDGCDETVIKQGLQEALNLTCAEMKTMADNCRATAVNNFDYRKWIEPVKNFLGI